MAKKIELKGRLGKGKFIIVDDDDYEKVVKYKWHLDIHVKESILYARTTIKYHKIRLHRFLLNPPSGTFIDHINRNGLDNRKCNLRLATQTQNNANTKLRIDNSSGTKGVYWDKSRNEWLVVIGFEGPKYLGRYKKIEDAILVRKQAEKQYFGQYSGKP